MKTTMEFRAEEIRHLRRGINNLVSLLSLPAMWSGHETPHIVDTLLDVLLSMLRLDFAYLRLNNTVDDSPVEAVRIAQQREAMRPTAQEIGLALESRVEIDAPSSSSATPHVMPNPLGVGEIRVAHYRLGLREATGIVAVGSRRADFPTDLETLLLRVAANQAAIALQESKHLAERGRAEQKLRRREQELSDFMESATVGLHWVGPDGIIIWANRAELELLGYEREEYFGRHISEFHDDKEVIKDILRRLSSGEELKAYEARLRCKDGSIRYVHINSNVYWEGGQFIHTRCFTRDITALKMAEEERSRLLQSEQEARTRAEEASRLKDEFLAIVSHELRTPLTAIMGWANLLRTGQFDQAATQRALEIIERNAKAQMQIIADLLDVSRIITSKLRLDMHPVDLAPVIQTAIDAVRPAAKSKNIGLHVVFDPEAGPISGDPDRLQQVFWNLLTNAIKFTPEHGRVEIHLRRSGSRVEVDVRDTGQGISRKFLPFVFDRFRQADSSTTRGYGGLGLGLAIVRQLVEMHGGSIRAHSEGEGMGAAFTASFPSLAVGVDVARDSGRLQATASALMAEFECSSRLEGLRVLAVDDEQDSREFIVAALEHCGAEVTAVCSADEALFAIVSENPDVLVCDIGMPGEDGYSLIRRVRALGKEQSGDIPAAALTAYASDEDRLRALVAGFQTHIPKPVNPTELVAVVANLANRKGIG